MTSSLLVLNAIDWFDCTVACSYATDQTITKKIQTNVALQDLLLKGLVFEVFPTFFHVYVVDITKTKREINLCPFLVIHNTILIIIYLSNLYLLCFVKQVIWNGRLCI